MLCVHMCQCWGMSATMLTGLPSAEKVRARLPQILSIDRQRQMGSAGLGLVLLLLCAHVQVCQC